MTLIKLERGILIDLNRVESLSGQGDDRYVGLMSGDSFTITQADYDYIIAAMDMQDTTLYWAGGEPIRMTANGVQYRIVPMTSDG